MIEVVSATRLSKADFWARSALGLSIHRLGFDSRLVAQIAYANERGLPDVYNERIAAANDDDVLVFVHDDVWIDDYFFSSRVVDGLRAFDVLGVAGNRRRVPRQTSWAFVDAQFTPDATANLSGRIAQGTTPFGHIYNFGAVPAACELLDGMFLAATKVTLARSGVRFDPRFDFHFYDMDFCRTARQRGLRLGTWPICLTHQSRGSYGGDHWAALHRAYLDKWTD